MAGKVATLSKVMPLFVHILTGFSVLDTVIPPIVVVFAIPEMLIFITGHNVEMIFGSIVEIMIVLCVSTQRKVALENCLPTIVAIVGFIVALESRGIVGVLSTFGYVGTKCGMKSEVFKSMYLIVEVGTSYKFPAIGHIIFFIQYSQWVTCC